MKRVDKADSPLFINGPYSVFIHQGDDAARRKRWQVAQRRLEYWLLVTSLEGNEQLCVDGVDYDLGLGDSYLIQPGALHDIGSLSGNVPVWLHFDLLYDPRRGAVRRMAGPYDHDLGQRRIHLQPNARQLWGIDLPVIVPAPLAVLFRSEVPSIVDQRRHGPAGRLLAEARLGLLLARLVAQVWEQQGHVHPTADLDRLASAEAIARQRLDTDFNLTAFATAAGLGRSRFCQLYTQLRGESPGTFLTRERQLRAESLLGGTDLSVTRIAALVGYADATALVRAFRRYRGITPGVWRLRQRQEKKR